MGTLIDYCFLEVRPAQRSWSMHTCVHDWTAAALSQVINVQQYWYAFDCVAASINGDDWDSSEYLFHARLTTRATRLIQDRCCQDTVTPPRLDFVYIMS